ncbi:MAG: TIGR01777 family oxidoreductase [Planctomycetes bacterium]|nr:TIGR01777 family oxidoreductase [Planctomycetota bacterium]
MRVLVTGATGLIGNHLLPRLRERGDAVVVLTRRPAAARERLGTDCTIVEGDPTREGTWMDALADCDGVINLAGESVFGKRWNEEVKNLLRESRVQATANVVKALARNPRTAEGQPRVLVNASAIGYYGPRGDEELIESSPPGNDFLAGVTTAWENAARPAEQHGLRTALVRIGIVLDPRGGALAQMVPPFKFGLGGPVASGKQWMSWIHYHDVVGILLLALDNAAAVGPINGTAPQPVTNRDFARALGRTLHRPSFLPVPAFALKLRFGEVAEVLTTGQRVLPARAQSLGYRFQFPDLDGALRDLLAS